MYKYISIVIIMLLLGCTDPAIKSKEYTHPDPTHIHKTEPYVQTYTSKQIAKQQSLVMTLARECRKRNDLVCTERFDADNKLRMMMNNRRNNE